VEVDDRPKPINVTSSIFEQAVVRSEAPVLVDFWTAWCGPCRMVDPIMDRIADEYEDLITVAKVNVDAEPELAASYGISSIPTIAFFEPGERPKAVAGALPKESLEEVFGLGRFSKEAA
jgi:thioredoxin